MDTIQVYVSIGCYYVGTLAESVMCINMCLMLTIGAHYEFNLLLTIEQVELSPMRYSGRYAEVPLISNGYYE